MITRLIHLVFGHPWKGSTRIDKLQSSKHHQSDDDYIYTVNIRMCKCGLTFNDVGMESIKKD